MRDILQDLQRWVNAGEEVALATVVQTWGSSPRPAGAKMAVSSSGRISGSVSGGCVEGAVAEAAQDVLQGAAPHLLHFGVADETAWEVGLACGGKIEVFVQKLEPNFFQGALQAWSSARPFAQVTVIEGPADLVGSAILVREGQINAGRLDAGLVADGIKAGQAALVDGRSSLVPMSGVGGEPVTAFVEAALPALRMVIVGGAHISIALAALAKTLGYRTIVVDPRRAFGSRERFPEADLLIQKWPDQALGELELDAQSAVAVLTHDPKLDDPALMVALRSQAFYVGALGSRQTQARRRVRLQEAGLEEAKLQRLRGPIGLDLGAQTPEEIALAILAEVVAARHGRLPVGRDSGS